MWYNDFRDTTYEPNIPKTPSQQQKERKHPMKRYTILSLLALSCLSCNPLSITPKEPPTADKHSFEEMNIVVVNKSL